MLFYLPGLRELRAKKSSLVNPLGNPLNVRLQAIKRYLFNKEMKRQPNWMVQQCCKMEEVCGRSKGQCTLFDDRVPRWRSHHQTLTFCPLLSPKARSRLQDFPYVT